jgi:NADPH-dependent curcumin reductase CurA
MVNACFECRYISQFKGLIDVINYQNKKTKKELIEEMPVQTGTPFGYWIIT